MTAASSALTFGSLSCLEVSREADDGTAVVNFNNIFSVGSGCSFPIKMNDPRK